MARAIPTRMMRLRLVTMMLLVSTTALADPLVVEEAGRGLQVVAGSSSTFVVLTDTTTTQRIRVYDVTARAWTSTKHALTESQLNAHLVDGVRYLAVSSDGGGAIYSLEGKSLISANGTPFRSMVRDVAASRSHIAVAGTRSGVVYVFDGKQTRSIDLALQNEDGGVGVASVVAFSPDGKRLAVGTTAHYAFEIDAVAWKVDRMVVKDDSPILAVAYTRDGKHLLVGSGGGLMVFDVASGKREEGPKKAPTAGVSEIEVSPDGAYVAVAGGESFVRLYSTATWKQKAILEGQRAEVSSLVWSTDGKYLACGAGHELRIWAPLE